MRNKGFDILLTHAPAAGINDMQDFPHRGFKYFSGLIENYSPKYFVHGHIHKNHGNFVREQKISSTTVTKNTYSFMIK